MRYDPQTRQLPGYERAVEEHPVLSREQEQVLFRRYADGDDEAFTTILLSNVRLVAKVSSWYMREGLPFEDLVQDGLIGLMSAVEKFQPERGHKFSTYATWWVRQAVQRAAWEYRHVVHVPQGHSTTLNRLRKTWQEMAQELGAEPTDAQIAERMGMEPEAISALVTMTTEWRSLDAPLGTSSDPGEVDIKDVLPDERDEHPIEALSREEEVERVLRVLSEQHRQLVERRYGIRDPREESQSYRSVEEFFGVSPQRLQQMETQAFQAVRELFSHEQHGSTRVIRRVDEKRDSEQVARSALEEAQMTLFH